MARVTIGDRVIRVQTKTTYPLGPFGLAGFRQQADEVDAGAVGAGIDLIP